MSATKIWYPHNIEKYRRKTGHLTIAEHGAYRLLMDAYWDRRGPLPADENRMRKLIGADKDEWESVRDAVLDFFTLTDDGWRHEKIDENLAEAERLHSEKADRLAKAREAKRLKKEQETDQSIVLSTEQSTELTPATQSHSQSHTHKNQEPREGAPDGAAPKVSRETIKKPKSSRLADDWRPPPEFMAFALVEGFSELEAKREADKFRDYWIAQPGAKGRKLDWIATWRNWIRRARDDKPSRTNGNNSRGNSGIVDPVEIGLRLVREAEDEDAISTNRQAVSGA